jgi:N-acetylglucosaminyldiphosphoundecaprenol N-acetyl-beta-D-mannosaminyltransferase
MIFSIFGVKFYNIDFNQFIKMKLNGLIVFPSGPGLSNIYSDKIYHKSIKNSDIAFFDSGFFVLLLRLFKGIKVNKFSGYKFLKLFLNGYNDKNFFVIEADKKTAKINRKYLKKHNINVKNKQYIAPLYKKNSYIIDVPLLKIIKKIKPSIILINLGGGTQEILGSYIKNNLKHRPLIICSGAAISFLTKQQAPITKFFDDIFLGWFIRIIFNPIIFLPRYLLAFKLFFVVLKSKIKN